MQLFKGYHQKADTMFAALFQNGHTNNFFSILLQCVRPFFDYCLNIVKSILL